MCVLALAWRSHPRWRLVLVANRDESHARPAAPLARWTEDERLLAGRDLASGGTWLGVSERGRLAVVTNRTTASPDDPTAPSRGLLLTNLLTGPQGSAHPSPETLSSYNPLNLITVADDRAVFASNRLQEGVRDLSPGLYGLSNATLDTPWPKTERLKAAVAGWLTQSDADPDKLLAALSDNAGSLDPQRPDTAPIFIRNPIYGTRCSTVVMMDANGTGSIVEQRFTSNAEPAGKTSIAFKWPVKPDRPQTPARISMSTA